MMNEWTSVKDAIPANDKWVFAIVSEHDVCIACIVGEYDHRPNWSIVPKYSVQFKSTNAVTHWMPIPDPPQVKPESQDLRTASEVLNDAYRALFDWAKRDESEQRCSNCTFLKGAPGDPWLRCKPFGSLYAFGVGFFCAEWKEKEERSRAGCGDPFCVRELNSVPVVAYQPEGRMPKVVGYSWLSKDAAQEIADNLNDLWSQRDRATESQETPRSKEGDPPRGPFGVSMSVSGSGETTYCLTYGSFDRSYEMSDPEILFELRNWLNKKWAEMGWKRKFSG